MLRLSTRVVAIAILAAVPLVAHVASAEAATNASGCSVHNTRTPDAIVATKVCITLTHQSARGHSSARTRIEVISDEGGAQYSMSLNTTMTEYSQADGGTAAATSFGSPSANAYKGYANVSSTKDIASHYRMWATVAITVKEGGRSYSFSLSSPKERVE